MNILIVSSYGKYLKAVKPFMWLLEKYWGGVKHDITLSCVDIPPFKATDFENVSLDVHIVGPKAQFPVNRWSNQIILSLKYLKRKGHTHTIMFLEDMWITRSVDQNVVKRAWDYSRQFRYVARFDLTADRQFAGGVSFYGEMGDTEIIHSSPDSQYHLSTMPAVWNIDTLLRVLQPEESPWDVEIRGTPRLGALRNECIVLGTKVCPIKNTLAFRGGDTGTLLLNELNPDDVSEMRRLGLFEGIV